MRTKLIVMAIVAAVDLAAVAAGVLLILLLGGWAAAGIIVGLTGLLLLAYRSLIQPWQARWGATDEEVTRPMPGDELIEGASTRTRAITIGAPPEEVWPWLVQLGDQIVMVPGMGPRVRAVEPNRYLLAGDVDGDTWCLALYPLGDGRTRLVSRRRAKWPITLATFFWVLVGDPGSFVMERRMLLNLKARAEHATARAEFALPAR